jgi:SH3-like domain-containing protein
MKSALKRVSLGMLAVIACAAILGRPEPVLAQTKSSVHLPRFVSLRATRVHLRKGPGIRFPIEWVYLQRDLPMEIIQVFDNWRRVRDWQGTEGWVYHSMLSGKRTFRVTKNLTILRQSSDPRSTPLAKLETGVVGRLESCAAAATVCKVSLGGMTGWLPKSDFWGAYQGEEVK